MLIRSLIGLLLYFLDNYFDNPIIANIVRRKYAYVIDIRDRFCILYAWLFYEGIVISCYTHVILNPPIILNCLTPYFPQVIPREFSKILTYS